MNRSTLFVSLMLIATVGQDIPAQTAEKLNICHINEVADIGLLGTVISIPLQAWPAHQRHFDYEAPGLNVGDACGIIE